MLSFVVLAKKNLGANPVIVGFNKHCCILQMHRFKSHSKEELAKPLRISESAVAAAPHEREQSLRTLGVGG
jgi:hypothetical protein